MCVWVSVFILPTIWHVRFQTLIYDSHQSLPNTLSCFDMTEIRCYYWWYTLAAEGKTVSVENQDFPIWLYTPPAQAQAPVTPGWDTNRPLPAISSLNSTKYQTTLSFPQSNQKQLLTAKPAVSILNCVLPIPYNFYLAILGPCLKK